MPRFYLAASGTNADEIYLLNPEMIAVMGTSFLNKLSEKSFLLSLRRMNITKQWSRRIGLNSDF
jgi:hypothetical protein